MRTITSLLLGATVLLIPFTLVQAQDGRAALTQQQASHFAALALKCVTREFPNKPEHVINNNSEVLSPKTLHPAFYGCYDWHSSSGSTTGSTQNRETMSYGLRSTI